MDTKWVIDIKEIRTLSHLPATIYEFELFVKSKDGRVSATSTSVERPTLQEEYFHQLTSSLRADVYQDGLLILKNGVVNRGEFPPPDVMNWVYGVIDEAANAGGFIMALANTAVRADEENLSLMIPLLREMMVKYPQYSVR